MSNSKEVLFETARKLMAMQSELQQAITALECDMSLEPAEKHTLIDAALDLCSSMFNKMKDSNKQYLEEMVPEGMHRVKGQYIAGVKVEGRTYEQVVTKAGYAILNKGDNKSWAAILLAASQTTPDVIQARITDSKVTEKFLTACAGLVGFKESSYSWSVKKAD